MAADGRVRVLSVAALVQAARAGDRSAFGVLYQRFAAVVYAILLARLPRQEASELVQDVFVQALERLPSLREPAAFPGWLCAIARRRAADGVRGEVAAGAPGERTSPDASPHLHAEAAEALRALQSLPEAYRETLALRLVQGLTGPEISELTGLTPDSVRVNLHRGFKLLRDALGGTA